MGAQFHSRRQQGYFLLVMLLFLVAGALIGIVNSLDASQYKSLHIQDTQKALALAKDALVGYAVTYDQTHAATNEVFGYLPCPDTDGDGTPNTTNDAGNCGVAGAVAIGLLPYKTLGLPDLRDDMGNCLWYAVSSGFKASATKPTPLNWDTQGQFSLQSGSSTVAPDDAQGGVAAVIIAPGAVLAGQTRPGDSCQATPAQIAAYLDGANAFTNTSATLIALAQGTPESSSNNDRFQAITPKEIFDRIKIRSDFSNFINNLTTDIRTALASLPVPATTRPDGNPVTQYPDTSVKTIGYLPDLSASLSASSARQATNWGELYRYVRCASGTYCIKVDGQNCAGALIFSGSTATGAPRTTAQRNENQLAAFVEDADSLSLLSSSAIPATLASNSTFNKSLPATDLRFCLSPQPTIPTQAVDFTTQIGNFAATTTATPMADVDAANQQVSLGDPGAGSGYGCIWYGSSQNLGELATPVYMRVYFRFQIANTGDGFTFAIADADATRNPSTSMCGGTGGNLGYAGNNLATNPIHYPKMALEIDRRTDSAYGDPTDSPSRHISFQYWGDTGTPENVDDDNAHGAGGTGSPRNPGVYFSFTGGDPGQNVPAAGAAITIGIFSPVIGSLIGVWDNTGTQVTAGSPMPVTGTMRLGGMTGSYTAGDAITTGATTLATSSSRTVNDRDSGFFRTSTSCFIPSATSSTCNHYNHVRLDIKRTVDTTTSKASFLLKAYITSDFGTNCSQSLFSDLNYDLDDAVNNGLAKDCIDSTKSPNIYSISDTITISKVAGATGAPMKNIYFGFTNAQGSSDQLIYIDNFASRISE
ncbi:MAG: hypothetical protein EG825_06245 [Rhodocyclaceae bacterium]|nr:hypothetical protein [Rhodocyclaceae bacterium]